MIILFCIIIININADNNEPRLFVDLLYSFVLYIGELCIGYNLFLINFNTPIWKSNSHRSGPAAFVPATTTFPNLAQKYKYLSFIGLNSRFSYSYLSHNQRNSPDFKQNEAKILPTICIFFQFTYSKLLLLNFLLFRVFVCSWVQQFKQIR